MKPGNIKRKAFTLVEILIVICVISILFVVLVSRVDFATDKSRQAGVQNDFHAMQSALHIIALENNNFTSDITSLAAELNKNLDSELSVRVENGIIKTDAKDPWGSEYVLEYDKPADTNGRVTLLSPGPDTTLKTQDDIKSEVVIKVDNGKTNIVIDNNPQEEIGGGEHTCLFNRMVKESQYIKTQGNCITPTVYYYSCSCGAVGTSTFHGSLALDEHIGTPRIEYQAFDANHNVLSYCSSCNVLISTVPEAHNMVNEECTLCHKVIHNHNYNLELVSEAAKASSATCTSKATYYYSCQCGALSTDTFEYGEVRAHTFTGNSTQYKASDATCSTRATYYKTCSVCGIQGTETFESGLANGPHPGTTVPSYSKLNETQHTKKNICTACSNEVSSTNENHNLNENNTCSLCNEHVHNYTIKHIDNKHLVTPASCIAAAKYYYSCTCDENGTTTFNDGTPLSHNIFGTVAEDQYFKSTATCLTPTTYYKSCTGCGLISTETFTVGQALGHIEQTVSGYAATCTTTGLTDGITCSRCNEIVKMQVVIHALGHEEITTPGIAATCTTSGKTDQITCATCQAVLAYSTTISALGHNIVYDKGYEATCTSVGMTEGEHCSRCDYSISQTEIPMLPHTEVEDIAISVTCLTNGYTTGKHCSVCNTIIIPQETIYATGHIEKVFDAVPPTCTQSGVTEGKTCSVCDALLVAQTSIPATGHTEVQDAAIAATCTQEGRTAGSHCSVCNAIISGTSTIEKIAHDYKYIHSVNATCLIDGCMTYQCNVCSLEYIDVINAFGHVDNDGNMVCDVCQVLLAEKDDFIEFTVDNFTLRVPSGYTWEEFVNSPYNTRSFSVLTNSNTGISFVSYGFFFVIHDRWDNPVIPNETIINGQYHSISTPSPTISDVRKLRGTWDFNETLIAPPISMSGVVYNVQSVVFFSRYSTMSFNVTEDGFQFYADDELVYDSTSSTLWQDSSTMAGFKRVMFTNTDINAENYVEVPFELYQWWIQNAHPVKYVVSGDWILNENVDLSKSITEDSDLFTYGHGSHLNTYNTYSIFKVNSNGVSVGDVTNMISIYNGSFEKEEDRYLSFGSGTEVSESFYTWLLNNAKIDERKIEGQWRMNDKIYKYHIEDDIILNFTRQNSTTKYIRMVIVETGTTTITTKCGYATLAQGGLAPLKTYYEYTCTTDTIQDSYWRSLDDQYLTIAESQYITRSEYEWFLLNASQIQDSSDCIHDFSSTIITPSSCIQPGIMLNTCLLCGFKDYESITTSGHITFNIDEIPATCTQDGMSAGQQCSVCNTYVVKPTTINALGHNLQTQSIMNATCLVDGLSTNECLRCDEIITTVLAAPGHIDEIKDGICDVCNEIIEYSMYIEDNKYKFTYNMTWGEWFASEYNDTDLIQVGESFIKINDDGKTSYKLSLSYYVITDDTYELHIETPQASDLIQEFKYQIAKITYDNDTLVIVTNNGVFSTDYNKLGISSYMDAANMLKDGSAYAVIYNEQIFYTYDEATADVKITIYVNGQKFQVSQNTHCLINGDSKTSWDFGEDGKWYLADENGNKISDVISTDKEFIITDDINLIYEVIFTPNLQFNDNVINRPLANADIEVYNAATGKLINKFKTNNDGIATIAGLTLGTYICKSVYEEYEIIVTETGFEWECITKRYDITTKSTENGTLHVYDQNGDLIGSVVGKNKVYNFSLFTGTYYIQLDNQEQKQQLIIAEDGTTTISPLQ